MIAHLPFCKDCWAGLSERDITVLALQRGSEIIPNPAPDIRFAAGDKLTCYGHLQGLRDLFVPAPVAEPPVAAPHGRTS